MQSPHYAQGPASQVAIKASNSLRLRVGLGLLLPAALFCAGCQRVEQISSYEVPKRVANNQPQPHSQPHSQQTPQAASGEPSHRMLGLIAAGDKQVWFFKLVGKLDQIDPLAKKVNKFLTQVNFAADKPTWKLPAGWKERPSRGMRLATIEIPAGDGKPLGLSVIGLGIAQDWDQQLLDNVNRWRGQLGLPATGQSGLASSSTSIKGREKAVLIDLSGQFDDGGMTPPFAGGAKPPFAGGAKPPFAPNGAPSSFKPATIAAAAPKLLYDTPKSWKELPATSMRLVNLTTGGGDQSASVRVSRWNAHGAMGDPTENVNRWRGMVGLPPVDAKEVSKLGQAVKVAGQRAVLFDIMPEGPGDPSRPATGITAAMFEQDNQVWFFMMAGPAKTVAAQRKEYDQWLASVRFAGAEAQSSTSKEPTDGDR